MNKKRKHLPPSWADKLLELFCAPHLLEEVQGDLHELYSKWEEEFGAQKARRLYAWHALKFFRPFALKKSTLNSNNATDMLTNYFKIALRNLKRNRAYALINIVGLALGLTGVILIFIFVKYHLSFDTFHSKKDRVYRVITEWHEEEISYDAGVPQPLGKAFRDDYTFAEKAARVCSFSDQVISIPSSKDNQKFEEEIAFAEPEFFDILDFPLVQGDKNTALAEPNSAIITEKLAKKYFGSRDPIGKTLRLDNRMDFMITGILRNLPANTDRRQEIYVSYSSLKEFYPWLASDDSWGVVKDGMHFFVLLNPNVSPAAVDNAFPAFSRKYYNEQDAEEYQFKLQHLSDIHFNPELGGHVEKKNLWALSMIGLFLIITACVNFINLATAQALGRSKEIGVRKVLGSLRLQLFLQFMAETTLITMLALGLAFALAQLALPSVNQLFDTQLRINIFQDVSLLIFLPVLLFMVIFFSGSYPGLIMASFKPAQALKGKLSQRHIGGFSLRRGLVVTQFAISQLLIIGTVVIANQMRFSRQADMGFQKEGIVMLPVPDSKKSNISTLRSQLSQITGVEKVAFCNEAPAGPDQSSATIRFGSRAVDENFSIFYKPGDDQYVSTFGLEIVAGRNLYPLEADRTGEHLINETAVKKLGVSSNEEVIGKKATINGAEATIVGVVKDFHNKSFYGTIDPLCITSTNDWLVNCAVKVNLANLSPTLTAVEKAWQEVFPNHIYKYEFLDSRIARFYALDNMMLRLVQVFAGIAIIIGCLGLYGLISFMVALKTKEVGVRKVLGARVDNVLWLFGKEFIRLLLIAFVIAAPLGWWAMRNWLENFTYRIEIGAGVFLVAIAATFFIAALTVGYQSIKAALANPVKSLRNE